MPHRFGRRSGRGFGLVEALNAPLGYFFFTFWVRCHLIGSDVLASCALSLLVFFSAFSPVHPSQSEDVISVWNRSASNTEGIDKIRESVKRILKIPPFVQVYLKLKWLSV